MAPTSVEELTVTVICSTARQVCAKVAKAVGKVAEKAAGRFLGKGKKAGKAGAKSGKATAKADAATPGTVDDVLAGARPLQKTKGRARQFEKPGGQKQADADFDSLAPGGVTELPNGKGRIGTLSDGRKVLVRTWSTNAGSPTLEIQNGSTVTKVRYPDEK